MHSLKRFWQVLSDWLMPPTQWAKLTHEQWEIINAQSPAWGDAFKPFVDQEMPPDLLGKLLMAYMCDVIGKGGDHSAGGGER